MSREQQAQVDAALERAAERLGDIVPLVMAEFYAHHPDARAAFDTHSPHGNPHRLEAEMVDNALYFVMTWFERKAEVEIIAYTSVPHHAETLHVPPAWYSGLLEATITVLRRATPPDDTAELALWDELREKLCGLVLSAQDG